MAELPAKPRFGEPCNGCGYCCTVQPCQLAEEFLNCKQGPCIALELRDGKTSCGLVRNPLGYLYRAAHPTSDAALLADVPPGEASQQLSADLAAALGIGKGCDSDDDETSRLWPDLASAGTKPD